MTLMDTGYIILHNIFLLIQQVGLRYFKVYDKCTLIKKTL